MTVIAWDGHTLAADKRGENSSFARTVTKIRRFPDGSIGGCSGDAHDAAELLDWYASGANPDALPARQKADKDSATALLVVTRKGELLHFNGGAFPITIEDKTFAMGCGRDYAITAMHLGKTAREAVEVACLFDLGCGNGIDTLTLEQDQ